MTPEQEKLVRKVVQRVNPAFPLTPEEGKWMLTEIDAQRERIAELEEYIHLAVNGTSRLIMIAGFPPIDVIFPDEKERSRVTELKAKLFPDAALKGER